MMQCVMGSRVSAGSGSGPRTGTAPAEPRWAHRTWLRGNPEWAAVGLPPSGQRARRPHHPSLHPPVPGAGTAGRSRARPEPPPQNAACGAPWWPRAALPARPERGAEPPGGTAPAPLEQQVGMQTPAGPIAPDAHSFLFLFILHRTCYNL